MDWDNGCDELGQCLKVLLQTVGGDGNLLFDDKNQEIHLPLDGRKIEKASVLSGGTVVVEKGEGGFHLKFGDRTQDAVITVIELELDGNALDIEPVKIRDSSKVQNGLKK